MIIVMLAREAGEEGHNSQELAAAAAAAACWCGSLDVLESCRFGF